MAERGVLFEHAISQAEKTRPSAGAYMTGLYPTTTGLWYFSDVLSDRFLTWAEIMRAQGYLTVAVTQNGNVGPFAGMQQGFDRMIDASAGGADHRGCVHRRSSRAVPGAEPRPQLLPLPACDRSACALRPAAAVPRPVPGGHAGRRRRGRAQPGVRRAVGRAADHRDPAPTVRGRDRAQRHGGRGVLRPAGPDGAERRYLRDHDARTTASISATAASSATACGTTGRPPTWRAPTCR